MYVYETEKESNEEPEKFTVDPFFTSQLVTFFLFHMARSLFLSLILSFSIQVEAYMRRCSFSRPTAIALIRSRDLKTENREASWPTIFHDFDSEVWRYPDLATELLELAFSPNLLFSLKNSIHFSSEGRKTYSTEANLKFDISIICAKLQWLRRLRSRFSEGSNSLDWKK